MQNKNYFFILLWVNFFILNILSCKIDKECEPCHFCNQIINKCELVEINTDPFDDCLSRCETEMVCGNLGLCIYETQPICDCNWRTGECEKSILQTTLPNNEVETFEFNENEIEELTKLINNHQKFKLIGDDSIIFEFEQRDLMFFKQLIDHHQNLEHIVNNTESITSESIRLYTTITLFCAISSLIIFIYFLKQKKSLELKDLENPKKN